MELGLALPQFDFSVPGESPLSFATIAAYAEQAERLGFGSLWLADHLFWSLEKYGGPAGSQFAYDPLVALAGVARRTRRARLGTLVLCAQLRPPTVLAKSLATLDLLSDGRLVVGVGAGWYEPEYVAAGVAFERPGVRLAQLAESLEILAGMLGGGPLTYEGRHYGARDAPCRPAAVQRPRPRLWVGGRGDRLLDVVARFADGWNTVWALTIDEYRARLRVLDAACERAGRDPAEVERSVGLYALVGEDRADLLRRFRHLQERGPRGVLDAVRLDGWRQGRLVGTVDEVREQAASWAAAGVGTLIACVGAVPFALTDGDDLELLAAACGSL